MSPAVHGLWVRVTPARWRGSQASRMRCGLARGLGSEWLSARSVPRIFSAGVSIRHCRSSCSRSKKTRTIRFSYRYLAACYAQMGRLDEAREIVARLGAITPLVVSNADYLRNYEQRELLTSGLRLAAGETS